MNNAWISLVDRDITTGDLPCQVQKNHGKPYDAKGKNLNIRDCFGCVLGFIGEEYADKSSTFLPDGSL